MRVCAGGGGEQGPGHVEDSLSWLDEPSTLATLAVALAVNVGLLFLVKKLLIGQALLRFIFQPRFASSCIFLSLLLLPALSSLEQISVNRTIANQRQRPPSRSVSYWFRLLTDE